MADMARSNLARHGAIRVKALCKAKIGQITLGQDATRLQKVQQGV
jgi:hypothetical protein